MIHDHAIDARGVRKVFGKGNLAFQALKGVDFQVGRGEFVMLAGPFGSGKTTLLSLLGCVLSATEGTIRLFDEDVSRLSESELPRVRTELIGFIFQGHNLLASLSAEQNMALQLELRGYSAAEARREALALLERVGLGGKAANKPGELSGRQRQRIAIARSALAGGPPLILADEPTAALDAENGRLVTEILRELGHTVVVVTHDNRIFHLADRIVHIEDGLIRE